MEKEFDPPVTQETKLRMSFLERYEGFCIDVIKVGNQCVICDYHQISFSRLWPKISSSSLSFIWNRKVNMEVSRMANGPE